MLELVDESLEAFFRAVVPLSATDVDVSFDAPDRDWSAKLSRPTVNVFLWDIRRSATRSRRTRRPSSSAGTRRGRCSHAPDRRSGAGPGGGLERHPRIMTGKA